MDSLSTDASLPHTAGRPGPGAAGPGPAAGTARR